MALSIAAPSERGDGSVYGGSVRGRGNNARPQSSYYGGSGASEFGGGAASVRAESRARSKSLAEPKQYNRDGRIILNYCKSDAPLIREQKLMICSTRNVRIQRTNSRGARLPEG
jgi:hypothetical protein